MHARDINVVRVRHKFLDEDHYIDPIPPTSYMSPETAAEVANRTIDFTLSHLNAKFERTFPEDGVETEKFLTILEEMLNANLGPLMVDNKAETCPHDNHQLFDESDYALDKVFPTAEEIEAMPDTIDTPERLLTLIIDGIERVYRIMMERGSKAEPDEATVTMTVEA